MEIDQKTIEQTAIQLGASEYAVAKWRQRQLPFRWQIMLAEKFETSPTKIRDAWK